MYLKSLELIGFKSFAEKTVVEFNKGITSIVGPNGSGKSNILDAILWVLGEQSYKNIRAKESSDVIFSGGKNKKSRSMAEVSLIIDNEDRYLDIDSSEVKITRRIHKTGENEYFINNRKTRLKDINALFMDTGIGKQAYSVIGQGRVERIVMSNPREIKEIIEEAAGIKRAKTEKEESLKKLKEVKDEVEKIEYVEKDLGERIQRLKEESLKARLYKTYTEKIDVQRYMVTEYNIREKEGLREELGRELQRLEEKFREINAEFESKKNELEKVIRTREEKNLLLEEVKGKNVENFSKMESLREEFSEIKSKISNLEIEKREKNSRKTVLDREIEEKKEVLKKSQDEYQSIKKEFENKKSEKEKLTKQVESLREKREKLAEDIKRLKNQNQNFEVDKIKLFHENQDLEKRILGGKRENARLAGEKEVVLAEFAKAKKNLGEIEENKNEFSESDSKFQEKISEISKKTEADKAEYAGKNKEKNELHYKISSVFSKYKAIENIIENNENFQRGAKYLLNEKIEGILGALVNLIEVPLGYEVAFQTLMGGYFQDIVVEKASVAQKAIEILKQKNLGRASFLPLDTLRSPSVRKIDQMPKGDGIVGLARDLVKYDGSIQRAIEFTLGNALIVENLSVGRELARRGFANKIVTLDGDVISSGGRMTGGQKQKFKDETLERKKELNLLKEEGQKLRRAEKQLDEELAEIKAKIDKSEAEKEGMQKEYAEFKEKYREILTRYDNSALIFKRKENEIKTLDYEIQENEKSVQARVEKIAENKEQIENIDLNILENEKGITKSEAELAGIENVAEYAEELNRVNTDFEILKVKMNSNQTRFFEIKEDYEKLELEHRKILEFESESKDIEVSLNKDKEAKKDEISKSEKENQEINSVIGSLEQAIKELEKKEKNYISEVKDGEVKIFAYNTEKEKLDEKMSKNDKELEYHNTELLESPEIEKIQKHELYKQINDANDLQIVKRKLSIDEKGRQEIGSVNLFSISEYERESEKYNQLVDQKRDLIQSRESLLTLIKDIENQIVEKFTEAFNEINKNFGYMCDRILNGAKGALKMTSTENILETGLELSVKYKNKPEQTLLLLSGGEKSMLAVAFIMAIFMYKPSPFTFFDEIEAALDEANTKKIVELLNEFISKSQFILITHNKETMKGSHRLYGVTMNKEIGESRLISVDMD